MYLMKRSTLLILILLSIFSSYVISRSIQVKRSEEYEENYDEIKPMEIEIEFVDPDDIDNEDDDDLDDIDLIVSTVTEEITIPVISYEYVTEEVTYGFPTSIFDILEDVTGDGNNDDDYSNRDVHINDDNQDNDHNDDNDDVHDDDNDDDHNDDHNDDHDDNHNDDNDDDHDDDHDNDDHDDLEDDTNSDSDSDSDSDHEDDHDDNE